MTQQISQGQLDELLMSITEPMLVVGRREDECVVYLIHLDEEGDFARVVCRIVQHWATGKGMTDDEAWKLVNEERKNPTHRGGFTMELTK